MKTDRELLELAAKAAGLTEYLWCEHWRAMARYINVVDGFDRDTCWNPLENDGDALRLAVATNCMNLMFWLDRYGDPVLYKTDKMAAIRRAIVRAAAAIQEAKEKQCQA